MPDLEDFPYKVCVSWNQGDTIMDWNLKLAWVVENIGLPGHRYMTHANHNNMTFYTRTAEDACFIALKCT